MFTNSNTPISEQDLGAILAGLRLLQEHLPDLPSDIQNIATDNERFSLPTSESIDELCEMLNINALPGLD